MKNYMVPMLLASAGGAASFFMPKQPFGAKVSFDKDISDLLGKGISIESIMGSSFPNLENTTLEEKVGDALKQSELFRNIQESQEQLKLRREIYDRHGSDKKLLDLNNGVEFFYEKDGKLSGEKLKDESSKKDIDEMNSVYSKEVATLKRIAANVAPDREEGESKISRVIVDSFLKASKEKPENKDIYLTGAKELLESASSRGLDLQAKNKNGTTTQDLAREAGSEELARYIGELAASQKERSSSEKFQDKLAKVVERANSDEKSIRDSVVGIVNSEIDRASSWISQFSSASMRKCANQTKDNANKTDTKFVESLNNSTNSTNVTACAQGWAR